eukprot:469610_1
MNDAINKSCDPNQIDLYYEIDECTNELSKCANSLKYNKNKLNQCEQDINNNYPIVHYTVWLIFIIILWYFLHILHTPIKWIINYMKHWQKLRKNSKHKIGKRKTLKSKRDLIFSFSNWILNTKCIIFICNKKQNFQHWIEV